MLCRDTQDYVGHVPKANVQKLDKKEKRLGVHLLHPFAVIQLEVRFDANFSVHAGIIFLYWCSYTSQSLRIPRCFLLIFGASLSHSC